MSQPLKTKKTAIPVHEKLKMDHEDDVLLWLPSEYKDYKRILKAFPPNTGMTNEVYAIECQVSHVNSLPYARNRPSATVYVMGYCGTQARISIFGPRTRWHELKSGDEITISGRLKYFNNQLQFDNAKIIDADSYDKIVPTYEGAHGKIKAAEITSAIENAIEREGSIQRAAKTILKKAGVSLEQFRDAASGFDPETLLKHLHCPANMAQAQNAQKIARKVCLILVTDVVRQNRQSEPSEQAKLSINNDALRAVAKLLPFQITNCQRKAVREIINDLTGDIAMNRLLSGDVGTGKTITYLIPAVAAVYAGYSVAIMTPNQLLAQQVADEAKNIFPIVGTRLIKGGNQKGGDKPQAGTLMVGTTALLTAVKKANIRLDFVIIDEQQKFSVEQKNELVSQHTNILEATATAIPRTLAVVSFGGMDLSILNECPVKKEIKSMICSKRNRQEVMQFIKRICDAGWQAAVIYAAVDGGASKQDGKSKMLNIVDNMQKWAQHFGDDCAVIHGKLDKTEQAKVMTKARNREIKVLVASSILEIGVNLPGLRAIAVINAENFGVSQLHQIRGRVARMGGNGWFFMYQTNPDHQKSTARLQLMEKFSSGFDLAEADAKQRGIGNPAAISDEQHGSTRIIFPNLVLKFDDIEKAINLQKQRDQENQNLENLMRNQAMTN